MMKKYGFVIILIFIYLIGYVIGFFSGMNEFHTTESNILGNNSITLFDLPIHERFFEILKNNMIVSFKNLFYGVLSFGIFPILNTFYNGICFGFVSGTSSHILTTSELLSSALPHSFEFLGLILFGHIGFLSSIHLFTKKKLVSKKELTIMFTLGMVITFFAAIIENYVSMSIS